MRPGSAGFVGGRLREAREARGLTGPALAELLGVSRQAISQYEIGTSTPHPELVERLAQLLNVPKPFFFRAPGKEESHVIFFRSMSAATKAARTRAYRKYGWLRDITVQISERVNLPQVDIPTVNGDFESFGGEEIETAAAAARYHFGLGDLPVPHVVRVLENHGAIVSRIPLEADTLDAFSEWCGDLDRPFVVLGADKGSFTRSRFDAAHELGHLVLHRSVNQAQLSKTANFSLLEQQANRFAGAFLLPAGPFTHDFIVPALSAFEALGEKWLVSVASMVHRTGVLGLVTDDELRRLWMAASRRGLRLHDPLDGRMEPEQPILLAAALRLLVDNRVISPPTILGSVCLHSRDAADLSGVSPAFFNSGEPAPIVELRGRASASTSAISNQVPGEVVPFLRKPRDRNPRD